MAIVEVKVPHLSESVAEATLLQWKKKPGDAVAIDEILIEIETDKVVLEVPAPAAGVPAPWFAGSGLTAVITHSPGCRSTNSMATLAPGFIPCSSDALAALNSMVMAGHLRLATGP